MAGSSQSLDGEIVTLYGLPLEKWTAARNALAKRLRGEGRKADAEAVQGLRKPSLSAWAVNQLFQSDGEGMSALLAAGQTAREAQGHAAAGRGADAFREALKAARRQVEELRRRAVALLAKEGREAGADLSARIARNLEALAFSPGAAGAGARGYLDVDLDPPGFEVLAGLEWSAPAAKPETPRPEASAPSRLLAFPAPAEESRAEKAARKREEAEAARRARAEARRRERIERAAAALGAAEEKAAALRTELKAAEEAATAARRQAEAAERALAAAQRHAATAEAEVAQARESLESERAGDGEEDS
jgi:hypothetical protein